VARSDGSREVPRGGVTSWIPRVVWCSPSHSNHARRGHGFLSSKERFSAEFRDSKPFKRERASHTVMTTSQEDHT